MPTINEIQDELIEEFSFFEDWMEKYEQIIAMGKDLAPLSNQYKTSENIVRGCQSQVWLHAEMDIDHLKFSADSDAVITKGIISLLIKVLGNQKPEHIISANLYFVDRIGLNQHLSQNRANGLASMIQKMKHYAMAYHAKMKGM